MNVPILLIQDGTLDSDGDLVFSFRCNNHYNCNGKYVLTSIDTCDFMDILDNGDYTKSCKYYSTLGCGHEGLKDYFCAMVDNSLRKRTQVRGDKT